MTSSRYFDFGKNWKNFSEKALREENIDQAAEEFARLLEGIPLEDKNFLDIGFGQGLSLLLAARSGAQIFGNDINPLCAQVLEANRQKFPDLAEREIPVVVGSILNSDTVETLRKLKPEGIFDIVHSWGVLHHTGEMWKAIDIAAGLTKPGGFFVLAIYNKHWTAPLWKKIKIAYNAASPLIQRLMVWSYIALSAGKMFLNGTNPFVRQRGMNIYYDAVDWVGGYPYEYASREEIERFLGQRGFSQVRFFPTQGFTGCNEFVFQKKLSENT